MNFFTLIQYLVFYTLIVLGIELVILGIIYIKGVKTIAKVISSYLSSAFLGVIFYFLSYFMAGFRTSFIIIVFPLFIFFRNIKISKKGISLIHKINFSVIPLIVFWFAPIYLLKTPAAEVTLYSPIFWKYFPLYFVFFLFLNLVDEKELKKVTLVGLSIAIVLITIFLFTVPVKVNVDSPIQVSPTGIVLPLKKLKFNDSSNCYEEVLRVAPFLPFKVSLQNSNGQIKMLTLMPIIGEETSIQVFMEKTSKNYFFEREVKLNAPNTQSPKTTHRDNEIIFEKNNYQGTVFKVSCETGNVNEILIEKKDIDLQNIFHFQNKLIVANQKGIYSFTEDGKYISLKPFPYRMQEDYYYKQFAIGADGTIFAADAKNIYIVGADGVNKRIPYSINGRNNFLLTGMVVNNKGEVLLSLKDSPTIYKFRNGNILEFTVVKMPSPTRSGTLNGVGAMCLDKKGHLFAVVHGEDGFTFIEEFDENGTLLETVDLSMPAVSATAVTLKYSPDYLIRYSYYYSISVTDDGYLAILISEPESRNPILKIFKQITQ